jgi:hypothetical protein
VETAPPLKRRLLSKPSNTREVIIDQATGETKLVIIDDFGRYELPEHKLQTFERAQEIYSIKPDDPLSARQEVHWTEELGRGRWKVRTETYSELKATKDHWFIKGRLEAYEGSRKVFSRKWSEKLNRSLG